MNIQKIQKWQKILEGQIVEMTDILERRFIFQETKKMVAPDEVEGQEFAPAKFAP